MCSMTQSSKDTHTEAQSNTACLLLTATVIRLQHEFFSHEKKAYYFYIEQCMCTYLSSLDPSATIILSVLGWMVKMPLTDESRESTTDCGAIKEGEGGR